jgi:hypothetical protein
MWEKKGSPKPKIRGEHGGSLGERALPSYRFVPAGTAWYRLVPDKIFTPGENAAKNWFGGLWYSSSGTQSVGVVWKSSDYVASGKGVLGVGIRRAQHDPPSPGYGATR